MNFASHPYLEIIFFAIIALNKTFFGHFFAAMANSTSNLPAIAIPDITPKVLREFLLKVDDTSSGKKLSKLGQSAYVTHVMLTNQLEISTGKCNAIFIKRQWK